MQQTTIGSFQNKKKFQYMGTAQILMPENYIAMFDAPKAEEARKIVTKAEPVIKKSLHISKPEKSFAHHVIIYMTVL